MTPKEKAQELIDQFLDLGKRGDYPGIDFVKAPALIAIKQILSCTCMKSTYKNWGLTYIDELTTTEYWLEVRKEIEKLDT